MEGAKSNGYDKFGTMKNVTWKSRLWTESRTYRWCSYKRNPKSGHNDMIVLKGLSLSVL